MTFDDLAALNREMAALVRARLPLEEGLSQVASDQGGKAATWASRLAEAMSQGMSLDEAIAAQGASFPTAYGAVVRAGQRSGKLAAALDGFADSAGRLADLRLIAAQAAVYPLLVMLVAWFVLLAAVGVLLPAYHALDLPRTYLFDSIQLSRRTLSALAVAVPLLLILFAAIWWFRSARFGARAAWPSPFRWIPGSSKSAQLMSQARFAELLQLLMANQVDLPTALQLAAGACGSDTLRSAADSLAASIAAGGAVEDNPTALRQLPPLVRLALASKTSPPQQVNALAGAAEAYRERASSWIRHVAIVLPVVLTILLGVFVVGTCVLLLFQPYTALVRELAK